MEARRCLVIVVMFLLAAPEVSRGVPEGPVPSPAPTSERTVLKPLWDYRTEIGLSDDQVQAMKDAIGAYNRTAADLRGKVRVQEEKLKRLIYEEAPIHLIRSGLQALASYQVELRIEDLLASRKVNAVMTADQLAKWRALQEKARRP